jgi:hypothetical protein
MDRHNRNDSNNVEDRLNAIEDQLNKQRKRWKLIKSVFFVGLSIFLLLFLIGVFQYVAGS